MQFFEKHDCENHEQDRIIASLRAKQNSSLMQDVVDKIEEGEPP